MAHLDGILARVGGNLNNNFQKSQMPGGGGMLKLRFDRYIRIIFLSSAQKHFCLIASKKIFYAGTVLASVNIEEV